MAKIGNFDVLIPLTGTCLFFDQTVASLEESSLLPDKIIVVDDGIKNRRLLQMLENDSKFLVLKNTGYGIADALNTGIRASRNEFVARIDGDDLVTKDRFMKQYKFLSSHLDTIVIGSRLTYIDIHSKSIGLSNHKSGLLNEYKEFYKKCLVAHPSVMLRKSFVISVGGYRNLFTYQGLTLSEDFDLWLRLSKIGKIENFSNPLTLYRIHENQVTKKSAPAIDLATFLIGFLSKNNLYSHEVIEFENSSKLQNYLESIYPMMSFLEKLHTNALFVIFNYKHEFNNKKTPKLLQVQYIFFKILNYVLRKFF